MKKMYDENEYIPKHSKPANDDIISFFNLVQ